MSDWNAALYRRFEDQRTRPAADLLARIPEMTPALVVDLGCGPGNSTELLVRRFADATVIGLDSSPDMLADARRRLPDCRFIEADIATWQPEAAPDLIFANASLQWLGDHHSLFPRLFALLAPGGVLAVQMPDNAGEPTHRLMREIAAQDPWADLIGNADRIRTVREDPPAYYAMLAGSAAAVDLWRTTYHHPMDSADDIVGWVQGTGLRPFLNLLPEDMRPSFLSCYRDRIDGAYPPFPDGRRLLAFPRLFIVARRPA
ncbi:MAG: trans-aconitate 2-methyltransferase [Telmatospirillum sp.]|nr:trans-aconitate 2-methyltransferase [Telmatospirillum sp.]